MNKIINLIGKTNKVEEVIKKLHKEPDINSIHLDGKNVAHMAVINKNSKLIDWLLDNHKILFSKGDIEGNTPVHLITDNGIFDLLDIIVKNVPTSFNCVNDKGRTPLIKLVHSPKKLMEILRKDLKLDYNASDYKNMTLGHHIVLLSKKKDDIYHDMLKIIINRMNLLEPSQNYIFNLCIILQKDHLFDDFLNKMTVDDLNKTDEYDICPLDYALKFSFVELFKKLVAKGVSTITRNTKLYFSLAIKRHSKILVNLLLDSNIDLNIENENLQTGGLTLINEFFRKEKSFITPEMAYKIISKSDVSLTNSNGTSILHLLCFHDKWEQFSEILKKKRLSIFNKNIDGHSPISLVKPEKKAKFIDLVVESYINQLNLNKKDKKKLLFSADYRCSTDEISMNECRTEIRKLIINQRISYPRKNNKFITDFFLVQGKNNHSTGVFIPILPNILSTFLIKLYQYPDIIFPFNSYDLALESTNINIGFVNNMLFTTHDYMHGIIGTQRTIMELSPFTICYGGPGLYYQNKYVDIALLKTASYKARFVVFDILIQGNNSGHANILIYDREFNALERFDPVGYVQSSIMKYELLDEAIKEHLIPLIEEAYKTKNIKFLTPEYYLQDIGFQTVSNDGDIVNQKVGDPIGYCFLWCIWYLESRLENPNIEPYMIIKEAKNKIIKKFRREQLGDKKAKDLDIVFIDFIRDYSHRIDEEISEFYLKRGLSNDSRRYKIIREHEKLSNELVKYFYEIMKDKE